MMKKRLVCLCLSFLCLLSFCACQPALSPMEEVQQAVTKTSEQNGFDFSGELSLTMESGDISMSYGPVKLRMKTQMEEDMPVAFETKAKLTSSGTPMDLHFINLDHMLYSSYTMSGTTLYTKQPLDLSDLLNEWKEQDKPAASPSIYPDYFSVSGQKSANLSVYTLSLTEEGAKTLSTFFRQESSQAGMPDSILQEEEPSVEAMTWTLGVDANGYISTLHLAATLSIDQGDAPVRIRLSLSGNLVDPDQEVHISLPENIDQYQDISSLFSPAEEDDSLQEPTTPTSITYYDESKDIYEYEEMSDSETAVLSEILNQSQGYTPSQEEQSTVLNATRFACFQPSESSMLYFLPYEDDFPLCDTMNHMAYPLTEEQRESLLSILQNHNLCSDFS